MKEILTELALVSGEAWGAVTFPGDMVALCSVLAVAYLFALAAPETCGEIKCFLSSSLSWLIGIVIYITASILL